MIIGIDIGGTHTDGVLVDKSARIVALAKVSTTRKIEEGFLKCLNALLINCKDLTKILYISVGSTHALNALLEAKELNKVGVLRLAGHLPTTIPAGFGWPQSLRHQIIAGEATVNGGYECCGRPVTALNLEEARRQVERLCSLGAESIAVTGVFSPMISEQEKLVESLLRKFFGSLHVTLSHQLGGIGFIERENAAILNASLKKVICSGFKTLSEMVKKAGLNCPLFMTQNNGSLITLKESIDYPLLTLASGPANSFIGGAKLAGLHDAIVVDVGGTSTDVGVVRNGFPKRSLSNFHIGGIRLDFPMPDLLSIAIGGGSHVECDKKGITIGPLSVGKELKKKSRAFGGKQLTLTDAAIAAEAVSLGNAAHVGLIKTSGQQIMENAAQTIDRLIDKCGRKANLPVVFVGGGSYLFENFIDKNRNILPEHAHVANAFGAAMAEVSVTINKVISLEDRERSVGELKEEALKGVFEKGARDARITYLEVMPYHYMPGLKAKATVTAAGKTNS